MAAHTLRRLVFADQRELCFAVIKRDFVPRLRVVTELTAAFINEFVQLTAVNVIVAAFAALIREVELRKLPSFVVHKLSMTGETGHGQMTSRQWILALPVIRDRIECRKEAFHPVTTFASVSTFSVGKLTTVCILVTVHADCVSDRVCGFARLVALRTGDSDVFTCQRIARLAVIK